MEEINHDTIEVTKEIFSEGEDEEEESKPVNNKAGTKLHNIMVDLFYSTAKKTDTIFQGMLGAKKIFGGKHKIIEDTNRYKLTDDEIRVGKALINIMTNWDDLFLQMGSNKFNKSSILLFLKEETSLNTKQIRDSMKIYKSAYYELKTKLINE